MSTRLMCASLYEKGNQLLPLWLSLGLKPNAGFEFCPFDYQGKRVVLFEIYPAAGQPVSSVETVIRQDAPLEIYRNPFLAEAMVNLNMIDTQAGGIKRMFQIQRRRFFPLPDYDLSNPERVAVEIPERILDERYTLLLMANTDFDLATIMLLDRVQKRKRLSPEAHRGLKAAKLVEGRYPNLIVAAQVAAVTGEKAKHIRDGGLDNRYYRDLIIELVGKHQPVSREVINELLLEKLPEVLNRDQKMDKIHNLVSSLSGKRIRNIGSRRAPRWVLAEDDKQ